MLPNSNRKLFQQGPHYHPAYTLAQRGANDCLEKAPEEEGKEIQSNTVSLANANSQNSLARPHHVLYSNVPLRPVGDPQV